jgi:cysteinyl-tRNA synthetase
LKEYDPNVLRMFTLRVHYRAQTEYTMQGMDEARAAWERIATFLAAAEPIVDETSLPVEYSEFEETLADDFNTPKAVGIIFDLVREGNEALTAGDKAKLVGLTAKLNLALQILGFKPRRKDGGEDVQPLLNLLIGFRAELRKAKAYDWADKLRKMIQEAGLVIEDTKEGTRIRFR